MNLLRALSIAAVLPLGSLANAAVTPISIGSFNAPNVLDFDSAPVGNVSPTSTLFTDFGLSSIEVFASAPYYGIFESTPTSSRALWANADGLTVVDPGTTGLSEATRWELRFAEKHTKFGFAMHDGAAPLGGLNIDVVFRNDGVFAGSIHTDAFDYAQFYFENTLEFDMVEITPTRPFDAGIAIDNFTLEAASSALPADFNHDGHIDAADYVVWRKSDGASEGYNAWHAGFGQTSTAVAAAVAAPEPSMTALLVLLSCFGQLAVRRRVDRE